MSIPKLNGVLISDSIKISKPVLFVSYIVQRKIGLIMNLEEILNDVLFPPAIDTHLIASRESETDKINRAEAIVDQYLDHPLTGKFLDMGCGEGHISTEIAKTNFVVAYDPDLKAFSQKENNNLIHALDLDQIRKNGPYDIILLFDTLDHCEKPAEVLKFCKTVLKPTGKIKARLHPWCSRHGTHAFHQANKAFIHMFFDELNLGELPTVKVIHPIYSYESWAREAGVNQISREIHRTPVEAMFSQEPYRSKIVSHYRESPVDESLRNGTGFPGYALEVSIFDVVWN